MEQFALYSLQLKVVMILTIGFAFASLLGYFSHQMKTSPVLGYLVAGYFIGPFSPGFVADLQIAEQLAEVGVILMMFSVGLHITWQDLANVKKIAIPGALGQTLVASLIGTLLVYSIGWSLQSGIIIGLAIGVASTVVLVRALTENKLLHTKQGHIAMGWLILEDILTVGVLLLLPLFVWEKGGQTPTLHSLITSLAIIMLKFLTLAVIMITAGRSVVHFIIKRVHATESQELLTLTVLATTFVIATGSMLLFSTSIALGAFIAGMTIGQTPVRQQVSTSSTALKDMFVVIFFLSVGMLFNPSAIFEEFILFIGILFIILIVKPLTAFLIALAFKYPKEIAAAVGFSLAQIGEFSFILAEEANNLKILPDVGYDIIVACAVVSIALNPFLIKMATRVRGV